MTGKVLFSFNDPPYAPRRSSTGCAWAPRWRWAGVQARVFLLSDAVVAAMANQKLPDNSYHLDRMIGCCARHGANIGSCGTCLDARGITEGMLTRGTRRSTLDELADWRLWAEQVVTF